MKHSHHRHGHSFVVIHVKLFRFGPGIAEGYQAQLNGEMARDLRWVVEVLQPIWVLVHIVAVTLLGIHLRHGFWSMFQSLGVSSPRAHKVLKPLALAFALALCAGFIGIPIVLYLRSLGGVG